DAEILLDAPQQRRIFLDLFLAELDAPIGNAAIEVLPKDLVELRLLADEREDFPVRLHRAHDPIVGLARDAARQRARPERRHPLRKRGTRLRNGFVAAAGQRRRAGDRGLQPETAGERMFLDHWGILVRAMFGCTLLYDRPRPSRRALRALLRMR